ncbi:MAG: hypothetical protein JSV16_13290, partial [Candidatus Hydrogenedentota bacterium]
MEPCSGCGAMAKTHPIVGIKFDEETKEMAAFPVCAACHRDPAHRKVKLKMHFFPKQMEKMALERAGSRDIGEVAEIGVLRAIFETIVWIAGISVFFLY